MNTPAMNRFWSTVELERWTGIIQFVKWDSLYLPMRVHTRWYELIRRPRKLLIADFVVNTLLSLFLLGIMVFIGILLSDTRSYPPAHVVAGAVLLLIVFAGLLYLSLRKLYKLLFYIVHYQEINDNTMAVPKL